MRVRANVFVAVEFDAPVGSTPLTVCVLDAGGGVMGEVMVPVEVVADNTPPAPAVVSVPRPPVVEKV